MGTEVDLEQGKVVPFPDSKQPAGTVARDLNFRDRDMVIAACRESCAKEGKGGHKYQVKLDKLMKLLNVEEVAEYFDMIQDSVEDSAFKWGRLRNNWLNYQQYMSGGISRAELKERAPDVDPSSPPTKPPTRQPEPTREELRGKSRVFFVPSKLDAWIQDAVKSATWSVVAKDKYLPEYVSELCQKLGIKDDE